MSSMERPQSRFQLTLYIAGESAVGETAIANLKKIEETFGEEIDILVVDIEADPEAAIGNGVNITPTLVRTLPEPTRRLIGDLSDIEKAIRFLKRDVKEEEERVTRSTEG